MANSKIDMTGMEVGKLKVIKYVETRNGQAYWLCRCSCGNEIVARGNHLRSGNVKSCGCLRAEENRRRVKHNKSHDRLYNIYYGMKKRCYSPSHKFYKDYGGRGITLCEAWLDHDMGFQNFYKWAIENGYKDGLTLERIDTNGNYCPENCAWKTMKDQANNRRNTVHITYNGKTLTSSEWERECGIPRQTILKRYRNGWETDRIFDNQYWAKRR